MQIQEKHKETNDSIMSLFEKIYDIEHMLGSVTHRKKKKVQQDAIDGHTFERLLT